MRSKSWDTMEGAELGESDLHCEHRRAKGGHGTCLECLELARAARGPRIEVDIDAAVVDERHQWQAAPAPVGCTLWICHRCKATHAQGPSIPPKPPVGYCPIEFLPELYPGPKPTTPARCTVEQHLIIRRSLRAFRAFTTSLGRQEDGDGGWLELGNCLHCPTTLAFRRSDEPTAERCLGCGFALEGCSCGGKAVG